MKTAVRIAMRLAYAAIIAVSAVKFWQSGFWDPRWAGLIVAGIVGLRYADDFTQMLLTFDDEPLTVADEERLNRQKMVKRETKVQP